MKTKLNIHASNVTSQHGEDGILRYIIERLGALVVPVACEFGAWDGVFASNVHRLWRECGWKAILIEGDAARCRELQANVAGADAAVVNRYVAVRGPDSIDEIFRALGQAPRIGVMSIDIDSFDYHVWKHMHHVRPQIVVIEFNQNIPPHIEYYDPEGHVYLKCSAKALETLGRDKGYRLVCCTLTNAIFVEDELFDAAAFPDMPVEWLFDYRELKPQVVFTGENGNMYPSFTRRCRPAIKVWWRIYYWASALPKRRRRFRAPPPEVIAQMRAMGMDA
jgi:hypothetical protein